MGGNTLPSNTKVGRSPFRSYRMCRLSINWILTVALWLAYHLLARFPHGLQKVPRSYNGIYAVLLRTVAGISPRSLSNPYSPAFLEDETPFG